MPYLLNGLEYSISFSPNEITVFFKDREKPFFFSTNVSGYSVGQGNNRVSKYGNVITITNSTSVCGDNVVESPNFDLVFEECEQNSDCSSNSCDTSTCYCN